MREGKYYCESNMREEVAKAIMSKPRRSYAEIADEFCMSKQTVQRIASEYGISRSKKDY